jgi:uncharacterized protein
MNLKLFEVAMKSVNYIPWDTRANLLEETSRLYENSGTLDCVDEGDLVAIKINVGELGNPYFVHPFFVRQVIDLVKEQGAKPFITDSNTYFGKFRTNAVDHADNAIINGFNGAPFITADGLKGENYRTVNTKGILDEIELSGAIIEADSMIVMSHVKGHSLTGFGGAIKNIAIGCASKKGMLRQHRTVDLEIDKELCKGCGVCVSACPWSLSRVRDNIAVNDSEWCLRCPACRDACPENAIKVVNLDNLSKAMASAAYGVLSTFKKGKVSYINFVRDITQFCDCHSDPGNIVMDNIGIFASDSPVSIDAAFLTMANYKILNDIHKVNCLTQVSELKRLV